MNLRNYIDSVGGVELSRRLGCSKQLISHWRTGRAVPTAEWAVKIERESEKQITRKDIRPDLFEERTA